MSLLKALSWTDVRRHYDKRVRVHERLLTFHKANDPPGFARLLLGISNAAGNYNAEEHGLGPRILCGQSQRREKSLRSRHAVYRSDQSSRGARVDPGRRD